MAFRVIDKAAAVRIAVFFGLLAATFGVAWAVMIRMPGRSYSGELAPADAATVALSGALQEDLSHLAHQIGERNAGNEPLALAHAADWLEQALRKSGYEPERQTYEVNPVRTLERSESSDRRVDEVPCSNIDATLRGTSHPDEIVLVGAHYDTAPGSPGADDNGSGTVALMALERHFAGRPQHKTLRFVHFVNEEPPYFWSPDMGSVRYAKRSKERGEKIVAMISLESIGFYSTAEGSQSYPFPMSAFYPDRGDFIGIIGNLSSRALVREAVATFRATTAFPSEGAAMPDKTPGVGWSDQEPFWNQGYPGIMITDTALFRNPSYHHASDRYETIDFDRMARVVGGVERIVEHLAE